MTTENSKLSNQYYQQRDALMLKNEGIVQNIYLDTRGIPTVGIGVALIYVGKGKATVDTQRVNKIAEYAHLSSSEKDQLMGLLQEQAHNLENNPRPDYPKNRAGKVERTLSNFLATPLGQASAKTFGTINGKTWNILTDEQDKMQINFSTEQVNEFYKIVAPEYEIKLDRVLQIKSVPKEAISEEQRAALFSLTYHGGNNLTRNQHLRLAIDGIKDYSEGRITKEQFESRIKENFDHVKGQFHSRRKGEGELLMHVKPRVQQHSSLDPNHNLDNFAHQTQVATAQLSPAAAKLAEQCEKQLIAFCERNNISATHPDDYKNIAMALTAKGIEARMSRVESVNVNLDGNSVAIFSHEPDLRYAKMQLDTATKTPAHESTLQVAQAENTLAREQAERQFNQNQSHGGRSMG